MGLFSKILPRRAADTCLAMEQRERTHKSSANTSDIQTLTCETPGTKAGAQKILLHFSITKCQFQQFTQSQTKQTKPLKNLDNKKTKFSAQFGLEVYERFSCLKFILKKRKHREAGLKHK